MHGTGLADSTQVVAFKIDQHHVFGPFLGVTDQGIEIGLILRLIIAARPCPGDRPRRDLVTAHVDQTLRGRADHRRITDHGQRRKRRGVVMAQIIVELIGADIGRQAHLPAPRQIDLKHIAIDDVAFDAFDAVDVTLSAFFLDADLIRCKAAARWWHIDRRHIDRQLCQRVFVPDLGQQHGLLRMMIDDHRRRDATGIGHWQAAVIHTQMQAWLDFCGQFISQIDKPAATERQLGIGRMAVALLAPGLIQQGQKRL